MSLSENKGNDSDATTLQESSMNLDGKEEIRDLKLVQQTINNVDLKLNAPNKEDEELEWKIGDNQQCNNNDEDNTNEKDIEDTSKDGNTKDDDSGDNNSDEEDKEDSSDSEDSDVQNLISHIFGDSDDDEEEFEGFDTNNIAAAQSTRNDQTLSSSDDEKDEGQTKRKEQQRNDEDETKPDRPEIYDFDLMMARKKQEGGRSRKRRNYDVINDSDDLIAEIIQQMYTSAEEDRLTNRKRQPARSKIKLLPVVVSQLKKADLKVAFLDQGILSAMAEWLAPLPDKSLPYLKIRESLLKLLEEFPAIEPSLLKSSRIGKIVMYLYKHPKETKQNKKVARQLIMDWSRPIFNVKTDFNSMSREERQRRDLERVPKRMRMSRQSEIPEDESSSGARKSVDLDMGENDQDLKPGEKGWIPRAVVPKPSNKEYLVRPKWNVETDSTIQHPKKKDTRIDKHMRHFEDLKKKQRGVGKGAKLSLMGN